VIIRCLQLSAIAHVVASFTRCLFIMGEMVELNEYIRKHQAEIIDQSGH
jgi:hypothetical protein